MSRVLVIDDAATVRMYHRKMLGDAGWHVEEAINGLEALEKSSFLSERAFMLLNPPIPARVTAASEPPQRITLAFP